MEKAKKAIMIVLSVILLLLAAVFVYFALLHPKKETEVRPKMPEIQSMLTRVTPINTAGFPLSNPASRGELYPYPKNEKDDRFLYDIPLNPDYAIMEINFDEWKAKNPEVIGYLDFETPDLDVISYPVMYRPGSDFYLTHDINGASNINGELYVEGGILDGHSRTNTIIYGHNMRAGIMFGQMKKYNSAEFYQGREFFWYYTPQGKYRYQIFSVHPTPYDGYIFSWFAEPCPEYTEYLTKAKQESSYDTGVTPDPEDEIITLCTCTGSDYYRLVVQGRLVYKDEIAQ